MAGRHRRPRSSFRRLLPWCTAALGAVLFTGSMVQLVPIIDERRDAVALSSTTSAVPVDPRGFEPDGIAADDFVVDESAGSAVEPLLARKQPPRTAGGRRSDDAAPTARTRRAKPASVSIPSIGVGTRLVRLGLNPDKTLQVPRNYSLAGWYTKGAAPGEVGPAVLVGHYDSVDGPAVFYRLKELQPGQKVHVRRADGSTAKFVVDRVKRFGKDDFPTQEVYGDVERPELRLITCGGSFDHRTRHYRDNVVVFAHLT